MKPPLLIKARAKIRALKERKPDAKHRPLCAGPDSDYTYCNHAPTVKAKINKPYRLKKKRGRGRPSKEDKERENQSREKQIGYWCDECEIFYYMNGSPDYRTRHGKTG